jgi:formylglycine-generating enzyme required for sulfatase activity
LEYISPRRRRRPDYKFRIDSAGGRVWKAYFMLAILFFLIKLSADATSSEEIEEFRDCGYCPELVEVPRGHFDMRFPPSTSGRGHNVGLYNRVDFGYRFAIGKFEVTKEQWSACVYDLGCPHIVDSAGDSSTPIVNITWREAKKYTRWLTKKTGYTYRLPSYSEWEYAARAGRGMNRYFNFPHSEICLYGNTYDQFADRVLDLGLIATPCEDGSEGISAVGRYKRNGFGLYDVIGNVSEWVEDCAGPIVRAAYPIDGRPWLGGDCNLRGFRGSSWLNNENTFLLESSVNRSHESRADDLGFRVVREIRDGLNAVNRR